MYLYYPENNWMKLVMHYILLVSFRCWECCAKKQHNKKNEEIHNKDLLIHNDSHATAPHTYDMINDIIKLHYVMHGKDHKICLDRRHNVSNIEQIYYELTLKNLGSPQIMQYPVLDAIMNDHIDMTERLNTYLGHQGIHLKINQLKIKWILSPTELETFKKLCVLTDNCEYITYMDVNEYVRL